MGSFVRFEVNLWRIFTDELEIALSPRRPADTPPAHDDAKEGSGSATKDNREAVRFRGRVWRLGCAGHFQLTTPWREREGKNQSLGYIANLADARAGVNKKRGAQIKANCRDL